MRPSWVAMAMVAVFLLAGAAECATPTKSANGQACTTSVDKKPSKANLGGEVYVEAVIVAECVELQKKHSIAITLEFEARGETIPPEILQAYAEEANNLGEEIHAGRANAGTGERVLVDADPAGRDEMQFERAGAQVTAS